MSLKLLQPGTQPLGQFDGYDSDYLTLKGGEIVTLISVPVPGDKSAADSLDGYVNPSGVQKRPVVTHSNLLSTSRPLFLADEGITGYGTLFGSVVGGVVGQTSYGPASSIPSTALLGPHTATGSGKVTCWDKPGLYAVSLDACDTATSTGLQPTNTTLDVGTQLTYTSTGLLTPVGSPAAVGGAPAVARFVDFESNGSLVTTPNRLVAALNSPSGNVSSVGPRQFAFATFWFSPPSL
jgi:hypothetical protein